MALTVGELVAYLKLDDKGFTSSLDKSESKFGSFGAILSSGTAVAATALAGVAVAAVKMGAEFDDAYDTIRLGTGATGAALEGLKSDFRDVVQDVPTSFADAGVAVSDLNTRLGLTGPALRDLSGQLLELSRITGTDVGENIRLGTRLFGDWSIKTGEQSDALDELFRATQQSGIGLSDLMSTVVQFGAPLRNMGFGFTESIAMLAKWEKEGVNTSTVLTGMKFALKNFAKAGLEPQQALADITARIHDTTNAQEAMTLGMETFGLRAGPDMVAAIREGRFQYEKLAESIANGTDTIHTAAKDVADLGEAWSTLANTAKVKAEPVLTGLFTQISAALADPLGWNYNEAMRAVIATTAEVTETLPTMWGQSAARTRYILEDLHELQMQPQILGDIDGEHTKQQLKNVRDDIANQLKISVQEANQIMELMFKDWQPSKTLNAKADKSIGELEAKLAQLRSKLARNLAFGKLDNKALLRSIDQIESQLSSATKKAQSAASKMGEVGSIVAHGINSSGQKVKVSAADLVKFIQLPMGKSAPWFLKAGGDASAKFGAGVGKGKGKAAANAKALAEAAKKPAAAAVGPMTASGTNAAMGFANGIGSSAAVATAVSNATALAQAAIDAVKAKGEEGSPWKTTMRSGLNMVYGLAAGIKKGNPKAVAAAAELAGNVLSILDSALGIGDAVNALNANGLPSSKLAKKWGQKAAHLVNVMVDAMRKELGKIDLGKNDATKNRFASASEMAGSMAGIFAAFVELTPESVAKAMAGIAAAKTQARVIAAAVASMVKDFRKELGKKLVISEGEATNADRASGVASSVASIFSTFVEFTTESVDKAIGGINAAKARTPELAGVVVEMVEGFRAAMALTIADTESTSADRATGVAGNVGSILGNFVEFTEKKIDSAILGLGYTAKRAPELATAMVTMVGALQAGLAGVTADEKFVALTNNVASITGSVTGGLRDLAEMTIKAVDNGIGGAYTVANRAPKLGSALRFMMGSLTDALGSIDATGLEALQASLTVLADISSKIAAIVSDLAGMTTEQLAAATSAGASLGEGFYKGLLSWHKTILAEANAIAEQTAAALGGAAFTPAMQGAGAFVGSSTQVVVTDNSQLFITLPQGTTADQAGVIARNEIAAWEDRKAKRAAAAARGSVWG